MSTYMAKTEEIAREWYVIDAADKTLGRLASRIAQILKGKHKPVYTPHVDTGDYVIVLNAEQVRLTGNKWQNKKYYHHSNYPGGLREFTYETLREQKPEFIIKKAVKGMMPHNTLGKQMLKKLKVYAGNEHPHQAQQPQKMEL